MEPASPELEPAQQRRQPLLVSLAAVTTTARSKPMLSTSTWRLRPLTRLPPSKPPAQWVRQPSDTDCVSAMATQGDWGRLRSSRTQGAQVGVNALPTALVAPGWEVAIHSLPRRKLPRHHAPGAASTQDIQNGLDHGWQVGVARPPQRGIGGELDRECLPLRLAQPSG